jgi:hypothetical protein
VVRGKCENRGKCTEFEESEEIRKNFEKIHEPEKFKKIV